MDKQEIAEFKILQEIGDDGRITQRHLAKQTGLSLSYLNAYLKGLVKREMILVHKMGGRRLLYNLTPKGMVEKVRMSTNYAKWSLSNYVHIRKRVMGLCSELEQKNKLKTIICGISEAAEIVYIATLERGLEVVKVVDDDYPSDLWLKNKVEPLSVLNSYNEDFDSVIICDIDRCNSLAQKLNTAGVPIEKVYVCTGQKIRPVTSFQLVD